MRRIIKLMIPGFLLGSAWHIANDQAYGNLYGQEHVPDMSEENYIMNQARNRYDLMQRENRNMERQDREMIRGYDPNEQSINRDQHHSQFENQEEIMRGGI